MSEILEITGSDAEEIYSQLETKNCKYCGTPLPHTPIHCYEHSNGWIVKGFQEKQWLFIICPKCNYQWSLWKLGYSQEKSESISTEMRALPEYMNSINALPKEDPELPDEEISIEAALAISKITERLEIGLLTAMARDIKGRGKEKQKRQELFVKFFKERFPDHTRTANLDYIGQWVGRFNCGTCYRNADAKSEKVLRKLGYTEGPQES